MTIEQRVDQLEKQNRRFKLAFTVLAVALCGAVTMAATSDNIGRFDTVIARHIYAENDAGDTVVGLGADDRGNGLFQTRSATGKDLVILGATTHGQGTVSTFQSSGKELVMLGATVSGGSVWIFNKTGENIIELGADEYGNGVVGAYNRQGVGRTLQPGPHRRQ